MAIREVKKFLCETPTKFDLCRRAIRGRAVVRVSCVFIKLKGVLDIQALADWTDERDGAAAELVLVLVLMQE